MAGPSVWFSVSVMGHLRVFLSGGGWVDGGWRDGGVQVSSVFPQRMEGKQDELNKRQLVLQNRRWETLKMQLTLAAVVNKHWLITECVCSLKLLFSQQSL